MPRLANGLRRRTANLRAGLASRGEARRRLDFAIAAHSRWEMEHKLPPFDLAVAFAVRACEGALELEMPVSALQMRMHDWVRCGDATYHVGQYFLTEADWASLTRPAMPSAIMREAVYLRASKLAFKETLIYSRYLEMMEQGYTISRNRAAVNSRERLDDYFERFASLYRSIEQNGVMRMRDVRRSGDLPGSTAPGKSCDHASNHDIGIAIGPRGEIAVLPGAQHRLAVASALKLGKVPVQVRMVHGEWLRGLESIGASPAEAVTRAVAQLAARMGGSS